jgi:prevent-host-death family protein
MNPDRSVTTEEWRRSSRELLNEVEHQDAHLTITRWGQPAAVIVPVQWYNAAKKKLGERS